jgi:hypothetical protein
VLRPAAPQGAASATNGGERCRGEAVVPAILFAFFANLRVLRVKQRPIFHAKSAKKRKEEREGIE